MDGEGGRSFLFESLSVGFLGAATVAIWFLMVDLVNGTPLQTPGILGSAVFFLVGVGTTLLVRRADRTPSMLALFVPLTVVLQALFVGGVAIVAQFLLGAIAWWAVLGGNLVASFLMGSLLLYWHPVTAKRLRGAEPFPAT